MNYADVTSLIDHDVTLLTTLSVINVILTSFKGFYNNSSHSLYIIVADNIDDTLDNASSEEVQQWNVRPINTPTTIN